MGRPSRQCRVALSTLSRPIAAEAEHLSPLRPEPRCPPTSRSHPSRTGLEKDHWRTCHNEGPPTTAAFSWLEPPPSSLWPTVACSDMSEMTSERCFPAGGNFDNAFEESEAHLCGRLLASQAKLRRP